MSRAKTRIVVEVCGVQQQLFSVGNGATGDLHLIKRITGGEGPLVGDGDAPLLKEHRFSLHQSPGTHCYTFKQTRTFQNGKLYEAHAVISPLDGYAIWPLFAERSPALKGRPVAKPIPARDTVISLASMHPAFANLVTFVFGCTKNAPEITVPWGYVNVRRMPFEGFDLVVAHTFLNTPSLDRGHYLSLSTRPPRINGQAEPSEAEDAPSFTPFLCMDLIGRHLHRISDVYREQLAYFATKGALLPELVSVADWAAAANLYSNKPAFGQQQKQVNS